MSKVETIRTGVSASSLFDSWGEQDVDGIDTEAYVNKYADALLAELLDAFPDADIEVLTHDIPGHALINDEHGHAELGLVQAIDEELYSDFDRWIVKEG